MRLLLLLAGFSLSASASYRVYQLRIIQIDERGRDHGSEVVLTTLDHMQYEHYHSSYRRARVEYMDSWYCPGDTRRRAYCPKPKIRDRAPAALRGTRAPLPYSRQPVIP